MFLRTHARRALAFAMTAIFLCSSLTSVSVAQRRARNSAELPQAASAHKQFPGTTHPRPPRTYDVQNYTIHTRFDVPNKTVIGDETITLKPLSANFNSFSLDASMMKVESVTLDQSNSALNFSQPPDKLDITLDRAYEPSDTISVRIQYRAKPDRGIYFTSQIKNGNGKVLKPAQIWSQGEPEDNHYWFPCYDFPDDKATSEQYITTAANETAISNGALVETINNSDGTQTFHWKMDQPHSSYLTSLVVGDYAKLSDAYKNIPVEYYTYHGTEAVAQRAFGKTPAAMQWFSDALKIEFPYNKYSQTIVANFTFGGMENITATTQSDAEILRAGSEESSAQVDNLVTHELAHSWFGDLVTCKNWSHAWLNEGLATFMESSFIEHTRGHDAYLNEMRTNAFTYLGEDMVLYRRPLVVERYRRPVELFDATLYKKGAFVMHMLRTVVGDEAFWRALNKYLNDHKYGNVETADLQRAFEEVSGQKLDWFFDQWVYKAGYPELRVRSFYNPKLHRLTLDVAQTQTPDAITPAIFRLPVDIELATAKGTRTEHLEITQRAQRFTFQLDGRPRMIRFDKGLHILKKLDFPQAADMVAYQLTHSSDAIGRLEAIETLARQSNALALAALRQAAQDENELVRAAANDALNDLARLRMERVRHKRTFDGNRRTLVVSDKSRASAPGIAA